MLPGCWVEEMSPGVDRRYPHCPCVHPNPIPSAGISYLLIIFAVQLAIWRHNPFSDMLLMFIVYNCIYIWLLVVSMFLLLASCCRLPTFPTYIAGPGYNGQSVKKSPGMGKKQSVHPAITQLSSWSACHIPLKILKMKISFTFHQSTYHLIKSRKTWDISRTSHENSPLFVKPPGMINMSFFFLNRFLDIADAIDDPELLGEAAERTHILCI